MLCDREIDPRNHELSGALNGMEIGTASESASSDSETFSLLGSADASGDQVRIAAVVIFERFIVSGDTDEFLRDFCSHVHESRIEQFLAYFLDLALDRPEHLELLGEGFGVLHDMGIVSVQHLETVIEDELLFAIEISRSDSPDYYADMAEFLAKLVPLDAQRSIQVIRIALKGNPRQLVNVLF